MTRLREGVCQFCAITDAEVDGNRISWHNGRRTCCSKYDCVKKYHAQIRQARRTFKAAQRKRSPAEIFELQKKERREKNKRHREAARLRGLLREKGGAARDWRDSLHPV